MTAPAAARPLLERAPARALQHPGDLDKLSRIRESHNHDLAQWGLRLANLVFSHPDITPSVESAAILDLIRTELEAERREMQDAGLLPWTASR